MSLEHENRSETVEELTVYARSAMTEAGNGSGAKGLSICIEQVAAPSEENSGDASQWDHADTSSWATWITWVTWVTWATR